MSNPVVRQSRRGYQQSTQREPDESLALYSEVADAFERLMLDGLEGDKDAQRIFNQRILPFLMRFLRACKLKITPLS